MAATKSTTPLQTTTTTTTGHPAAHKAYGATDGNRTTRAEQYEMARMGVAVHNEDDGHRDDMTTTCTTLRRFSDEYAEIHRLFYARASSKHLVIERIARVDNPVLWARFCRRREEARRSTSDGSAEVALMFHGTPSEYVDSICVNGFNRESADRSHGHHASDIGLFFTEDSSQAAELTNQSAVGCHFPRLLGPPGGRSNGLFFRRSPPKPRTVTSASLALPQETDTARLQANTGHMVLCKVLLRQNTSCYNNECPKYIIEYRYTPSWSPYFVREWLCPLIYVLVLLGVMLTYFLLRNENEKNTNTTFYS